MKKHIRLIFLAVLFLTLSKSYAQLSISVSVHTAPPELPVYVQPACPVDGYLWVPGYWAYDNNDGYYWVPGVWVAPPQTGYLWTPAYWGYEGGYYGFHAGYWGEHVGYYGGINYGYGYGGYGYGGGGWQGGHFRYNTAVVNVNTTVVHNTYIDNTVINRTTVVNHTSFNGPGGVTAQPRDDERAAMREQHIQATNEQQSHQQFAHSDRSQFASVNNGHPAATALNRVNGTPVNEHGQAATNTAFGHGNGGNRTRQPGISATQQPTGVNHPADNPISSAGNPNHGGGNRGMQSANPAVHPQHQQQRNVQPPHNNQPPHNIRPKPEHHERNR